MSNIHEIHGKDVHPQLEGIVFNDTDLSTLPENKSIIVTGYSGSGKKARAKVTAKRQNLLWKESGALFRGIGERLNGNTRKVLNHFIHAHQDENQDTLKNLLANEDAVEAFLEEYSQRTFGESFRLHKEDRNAVLYSELKLYAPVNTLMYHLTSAIHPCAGHMGYVGDGWLRSPDQVEPVFDYLKHIGHPVEGMLLVHADPNDIFNRTVGRMQCKPCNLDYNARATEIERQPLGVGFTQEGIPQGLCRTCEEPLTHRKDDDPQGVRRRFREYDDCGWDTIREVALKGIPVWVTPGNVERFEDIPAVVDATYRCDASIRDLL